MEITLAELNLLSPRERRHVLNAMVKIAEKTGRQSVRRADLDALPEVERSRLIRWLVR